MQRLKNVCVVYLFGGRGFPRLAKGARLKIEGLGGRSRGLGLRGFESHPPHLLVVRARGGGGGCSRRRRGSPFSGLFYCLGAFSGFLGGDCRGVVVASVRVTRWYTMAALEGLLTVSSHLKCRMTVAEKGAILSQDS